MGVIKLVEVAKELVGAYILFRTPQDKDEKRIVIYHAREISCEKAVATKLANALHGGIISFMKPDDKFYALNVTGMNDGSDFIRITGAVYTLAPPAAMQRQGSILDGGGFTFKAEDLLVAEYQDGIVGQVVEIPFTASHCPTAMKLNGDAL